MEKAGYAEKGRKQVEDQDSGLTPPRAVGMKEAEEGRNQDENQDSGLSPQRSVEKEKAEEGRNQQDIGLTTQQAEASANSASSKAVGPVEGKGAVGGNDEYELTKTERIAMSMLHLGPPEPQFNYNYGSGSGLATPHRWMDDPDSRILKCLKALPGCGHLCQDAKILNIDPCTFCTRIKDYVRNCGHTTPIYCGQPTSLTNCKKICGRMQNCGHECRELCHCGSECAPTCGDYFCSPVSQSGGSRDNASRHNRRGGADSTQHRHGGSSWGNRK